MLPCGAGKSLVGVSAACRIRKSCLCLATNAVSVDQWAFQFRLWSNIREDHLCRFTSDSKERFRGNAGVVVTTYNMVAFGGKRSEESEKIIEEIRNREWGLLLMDEVIFYHFVDRDLIPARPFICFMCNRVVCTSFSFGAGACGSCSHVSKGHQPHQISLQTWAHRYV